MSGVFRWRFDVVVPAFSLVFLAVFYYVWTWSTEIGDFGGDNAIYLLTAEYFSPWREASPVAAYFAKQSQYPPLYPLILALFGADQNLLFAHIVTTTCLIFAFAVFYDWLRQLRFSMAEAIAATLLFAVLPGTYIHALSVLSENLYLLLTLISLLAVTKHEIDKQPRWLWIAACAIAGATLTRSVGITLMGAFFLYLLLHRPPMFWRYMVATMLPIFVWQLVSTQTAPGYISSLIERYGSDPLTAFINHLGVEAQMIATGWIINFTSSSIGLLVMAVIGVICLAGLIDRIVHRRFDGFYVAFYLLLILIWPFPAEAQRFVLVIAPILLAHGMLLLDRVVLKKITAISAKTSWLLIVASMLIVLPSLLLTVQRFMQPAPPMIESFRRTSEWYALDPREARDNASFSKALVEHLRSATVHVPEGECIYSIKPSVVGYYARRVSVIPPRHYFDSATFDDYLKRTNCRYFYLLGFISPSFPSLYYPLQRLENQLVFVSAASLPGREGMPVAILAERRSK